MMESADKDFKTATINMFKELKKNMNIMSKQIDNSCREMEQDRNS